MNFKKTYLLIKKLTEELENNQDIIDKYHDQINSNNSYNEYTIDDNYLNDKIKNYKDYQRRKSYFIGSVNYHLLKEAKDFLKENEQYFILD